MSPDDCWISSGYCRCPLCTPKPSADDYGFDDYMPQSRRAQDDAAAAYVSQLSDMTERRYL